MLSVCCSADWCLWALLLNQPLWQYLLHEIKQIEPFYRFKFMILLKHRYEIMMCLTPASTVFGQKCCSSSFSGGCGRDTANTWKTCVEARFIAIRRSDANTATVHGCSTSSDERYIMYEIGGRSVAGHVGLHSVFNHPKQRMLTLDTTESLSRSVPSALLCLPKGWKMRCGHYEFSS